MPPCVDFPDLASSMTSTTPALFDWPAAPAPEKRAWTKRVTIKPFVTVHPIEPIDEEHKHAAHYSREDLAAFRKDAKDLSRNERERTGSRRCEVHADPQDCYRCENTDPALRGLEQYLCYPRARNRVVARGGVLKWHRRLESRAVGTDAQRAGSLALFASRLSLRARRVALETARQDSLAARSSDYLISVPRPVDIQETCFLPNRLTRRESRRVTIEEDEELDLAEPACKRRRF